MPIERQRDGGAPLRGRWWRLAATALVVGGLLGGGQAADGPSESRATGRSSTEPGRAVLGPLLPARLAGRSSDLESGGFADFDEANTQKGSLVVDSTTASRGSRSAAASFRGGGGVGFARALWFVDWRSNEVVCYGGSFLLPRGFVDRIAGTVDLVRWDNYGDDAVHTDHGGLTVWSDGGLRLLREQLGRDDYQVLLGPFPVQEQRWIRLVVQQQLGASSSTASSTVYVDGRSVGTTLAPNSYGRPVTTLRMGVVAVDAARQDESLALRFDDAFYRDGPCTVDDL